ncbi:hypothetical protein [Streptomyces sp. NPDC093094]|uniref:hypothetical protein n=1 Tax=Streptomyces sp. NPDC093094 TaxID=3366026 RepID=UPI003828ACE8
MQRRTFRAAHPPPPRTGDATPLWRVVGLESMAAILVVSVRRVGRCAFEAWCQWPRLHPLNERRSPVAHHPLIMAESLRQLAAVVQRRFMPAGVAVLEPVSVRFGLAESPQPAESGGATEVFARVTTGDTVLSGGRLAAYRISADYFHAGERFAACTLRVAPGPCGGAGDGCAAPPPGLVHPPAAAVGAAAELDVMVARESQGRLVVAPRDPGHPVILPGGPSRLPALALLEAGRQAALLSCGVTSAAVTGLSVDVQAPVHSGGSRIEVVRDPLGLRFAVLTGGRVDATGTVGLARPA